MGSQVLECKDGYMVTMEKLRPMSGGGWVITKGGRVLQREAAKGAYRFGSGEDVEQGRFDNGIEARLFWLRNREQIDLG